MELKEEVRASILGCVPDAGDAAIDLTNHLVDVMKLKCSDQLKYVKEEDLLQHLSPFEARALLEMWSGNKENQGQDKQQLANPANIPTDRAPASLLRVNNLQTQHKDWNFQIDWGDLYKISPQFRERLSKGKKMRKKEKKELIHRVVLQVKNKVPGAQRSVFVQIVRDMKSKYPVTFSSELAEGKLGSKSLCAKMKSKFDETKRAPRRTQTELEAPSIRVAYGCIKWRAVSMPDGETCESLQEKQEQLADYFEARRPAHWDWEYIEATMAITYGEQRKDINKQAEEIDAARKKEAQEKRKGKHKNDQSQAEEENVDDIAITTTDQIRDKWPFLFTPRCMLQHFKTLTGVEVMQNLISYLSDGEGAKITTFLLETNKSKATKKIKKRMTREKSNLPPNDPELIGLLKLLFLRFEEHEDAVWIMTDPTAKEDDIPTLCTIPNTPRLIIPGTSIFKPKKIYFCMDGHVLGTAENFVEALSMLYAAYFVFNLNYDANAQVTLEFIQRCIASINPARGNKRPPKAAGGHFSSRQVHSLLSQLDTKYDEFFAEKVSSSSSSNDSF